MSDSVTVGEIIAAFLENCGVETAFGVISIHNMPILDAIGRRKRIRFVPARGEAGAVNMADANARVRGKLGVAVTSTGTGAGNASGALIEAQSAGTPLLHLTGQIEVPYLDRNRAYIHEARDQLGMLRAVSKAAFRVSSPETVLSTLKEAVSCALTAPSGPVSVEFPIDVQEAEMAWPADLEMPPITPPVPSETDLDFLAQELSKARRPMLWLGGGARHAGDAVHRLAAMGFGIVTSTQGRGVLPEDHASNLGAFNSTDSVESLYKTCDAMLVVGSKLRGNETLKYSLYLPSPLYQIDADPTAENRSYAAEFFVCGDSRLALEGLCKRLQGRMNIDPAFSRDLDVARKHAIAHLRHGLGPYTGIVDALQKAAGRDFIWVRDVTVSNSMWGNRLLQIFGPRDGVHALGGGIGQGLQMAIGAALAAEDRRVFCLVGDGGLMLNLGELATAAQEHVNVVLIVMNDRGYGVIKNIQERKYGARHYYVDLLTPDFSQIAAGMGWRYHRLADGDAAAVGRIIERAMGDPGPVMIEADMTAMGCFTTKFSGPPERTSARMEAS